MSEVNIKHEGVVSEVIEGIAKIKLLNISACSSCHAKAACNVSDVDNKEIEVLVGEEKLSKGDHINVLFNEQVGVKALVIGYVAPFVLMIATLIIAWILTKNEVKSGLIAISTLIPYYSILTLFRKKFNHVFSFKIEKLNPSV